MTDTIYDQVAPQSWSTESDLATDSARTIIVRLPGTVPGPLALVRPPVRVTPEEEYQTRALRESQFPYAYGHHTVRLGKMTREQRRRVLAPLPAQVKKERALCAVSDAPQILGHYLGMRLRRRGRLTNALEQAMTGSISRWKDLTDGTASPARAWISGYCQGSLSKMSAGEDITGHVKDGEKRVHNRFSTVWVPFSIGGNGGNEGDVRALQVCPELVAELVKRRMFRSVTSVLLGSLRGRAVIWADEKGVSAMDLVRILPGTIALAMLPMPDEVTALGALRGSAGVWSAGVLGDLERGKLTSAPPPPLGSYLRGPLSWFFKRQDTRVLAPGVDTLTLSA